ncbi:MAG TPA: hypothetical protein PLF26_08650, partial [Blastocatellia bacterium]|nr:hypothetical protein [Blastocatellia bacterium]
EVLMALQLFVFAATLVAMLFAPAVWAQPAPTPAAQPPGPASTPIATPTAENASMRVYRYELEPGAGTPQHTHTRPYLLVAVTDIDLGMTSPDGSSMEHQVKAGDMHWVDSTVTHTIVNRGTEKAILVEFELK